MTTAVEALSIFLVLALSLRSGNFRKMPCQIKFALLYMMVFFPANLAYFFMEFGELRKKALELMALQVLLWDCLHWQFTYYYLETAALFRLTFQSHNDADFARVKRRQRKLHRVQVLGYLVLVAQFCAYITVV